jgi:predicted TIM-barrel fold metal-dependent hydrolase
MTASNLESIRGRINDLDSHEMLPTNLWPDLFGNVGSLLASFVDIFEKQGPNRNNGNALVVDVDTDVTEINPETIWTTKGPRAPGAIDLNRRPEVLDCMGVHRQLVFPGFGLFGMVLACSTPEEIQVQLEVDTTGIDLQDWARQIERLHNDWALQYVKTDPERLRPVCMLCCMSDLDALMGEAERVLADGARAVWISATVPPGGKSPADRSLDPFWALFEQANAAVLLHLGNQSGFMRTPIWSQIPDFQPDAKSIEAPFDPHTMATLHMAEENFLTTLILGGVFERHPRLRFGVIECGSHWVGPMAENLDMWASKFPVRLKDTISMRPSDYVSRNLRVTPYWFEPVDRYIERYGLEDVYAYSSDYPHVEGGTAPLDRFVNMIRPLGDEVFEKFFVTNGEWLVPA